MFSALAARDRDSAYSHLFQQSIMVPVSIQLTAGIATQLPEAVETPQEALAEAVSFYERP
jgi:hypothetical protein